jgi:hypothetical protein
MANETIFARSNTSSTFDCGVFCNIRIDIEIEWHIVSKWTSHSKRGE